MENVFETLGRIVEPVKKTCNCVDVDFGSYSNQIELPRPPHMPTSRGIHTICIDVCLKDEILYLWSLGIITTGCCCGHNKGGEFPYIGVDESQIQRMKAMGYKVQPNKLYPEREDSFSPKSIKNLDLTLSISDFVDGFKYEAWVGYEWTEVEYPKTGFGKSQLGDAINKKLVRAIYIKKP